MSVPGGGPSAHVDDFVARMLPPKAQWPDMDYTGVPELGAYPDRLNAAVELLDRMVEAGHGERPVLHCGDVTWTYGRLLETSNRIAGVLTGEMGLEPGNRVLLRGPNNLMTAAALLAVLKAGGVCVATMPLLRAKELAYMLTKAEIRHALCDLNLAEEMMGAMAEVDGLEHLEFYSADGTGADGAALEGMMAEQPATFANVDTAADDPALIAFTSGTTGDPKGTVHFHRDIIATTDCFPRHTFAITPDDVFTGSPPLAFTFGLGAFLMFPMRFGASTALIPAPSPDAILDTIERHRCTGLYTAPTMFRVLTGMVGDRDISSLRKCVSAGEHLPKAFWEDWHAATGIRIVDGIGSTEMLHIFIASAGDDIRPGSTGRAVPGYAACILDENGNPAPPGTEGRLAVRGPTGCRYLDNPDKQAAYVVNGWNVTGDIYRQDEDGYFWYVARGDDMIISAGYNISGPEVESALLEHPKVMECAVVSSPDPDRGSIVKAFVVLNDPAQAGDATARELQDHVKATIAPYKYPRAVEFTDSLPKTQTGKLQRFVLREREWSRGG